MTASPLSYLQTTLVFKTVDGIEIPFQNGNPVPTFDPQERSIISLNGCWGKKRFEADHDFSMAPRDAGWLEQVAQNEGMYLVASSDVAWEPHHVPLPENRLTGEAAASAAETYENGVWYQRTFTLAKLDESQVYTLKSLGVSYICDIWINGQWIGFHEGGFTPFAFHVTSYLQEGDNDIRIRVDNPPWGSRIEVIPAEEGTDFFNYTGIIQDLYLEAANAVHLVRADVVPLDTAGKLSIRVVVSNQGSADCSGMVEGVIFEADQACEAFLTSPLASSIKGGQAATEGTLTLPFEAKAGETRVLQFEVTVCNPKLWSLGVPNLYVGEWTLSSSSQTMDTLSTQFGIRTVRTESTRILLNEAPVFLAGIARHEEWPETGRTADWDRIRADLEQIRTINANMVRTGHYPNHVHTYLLLDRFGFAAMSEIPLWQFEKEHYVAQEQRQFADQMWREMVFSQYNRPSVLMWSTQNESKEVALRLEYNRRLVQDLRTKYNDGRLITQSAAADQPGPEDASMEPLDVAGWTMYFGIFHGGTPYEGTREFLENAHRAFPDKPILNTEFGHWTGERDVDSDMQIHIYETTLKALMEQATHNADGQLVPDGYVAGIDFWIMYDWYVNHNNWIDTFGLYHMDRKHGKPLADQLALDYGALVGSGKAISKSAH
ncbi:glycoside hydrolase family 2 sugar binding [Paenibacillus curdlanolyticus YK9]|uniref:Glycoside hydrolase family 2 sugar binding n=1 Tax=Paenibacillus curdlanolyticus YK9 TaxID=717606 RepID=E0IBL4_9BACL|nr:glycoside hydrolase family 2 [Paenibacillus curdlanolyticus]EFM10094.1 glycoside hydrolase family 2 sugar binding [Paenibacillus curdlanolyticus YK9]